MVKVISIQDDVYNALSNKKDGKSFSQVIRELINTSHKDTTFGDLMVYLGTLPPAESRIMKHEVESGRKRASSRNIEEI